IVEHDVIRAGHAHEVVAARRRQQQKQIVSGVLVGSSVVRVADIASHGQSQELAHEMVFESSAYDLSFVIQVFRPDESNDAVNQKGIECTRNSVSSGFESQLINSVMRVCRKSTPLSGLEVHDVVADPCHIATAMVRQDAFPAFAQHSESDSKAA